MEEPSLGICLFVAVGLIAFAAIKWALRPPGKGQWQLTMTQFMVFFTIFSALAVIYGFWIATQFFDPLER